MTRFEMEFLDSLLVEEKVFRSEAFAAMETYKRASLELRQREERLEKAAEAVSAEVRRLRT